MWRRALPVVIVALGAALLGGTALWWAPRALPARVVRAEIAAPGAMALNILTGDRHLVLTPDGSRLIYRGDGQLLVRALDQLEPHVVTGLGEPRGMFVSPDGQWIGFFDRAEAIKKVSVTGGPAVMISRMDGTASRGAVWAPDGRRIYYSAPDGMWAVDVADGPRFSVGRPRQLFSMSGFAQNFDITPDGRRFVMVQLDTTPPPGQLQLVLNLLGRPRD